MSHCVEKLPHKTDKCNSSDALQVFEDKGKYSGFCFACGTYVPDPYENRPKEYKPVKVTKSKEEIDAEIDYIQTLPFREIPDRKLSREALEHFGVRVAVSEVDGSTPVAAYLPYYHEGKVIGYQVRLLTHKKIWSIGDVNRVRLFGWDQAVIAGGKKLFITEGGFDAIALYQALKDKNRGTQWDSYDPSVISVQSSSSAANDIQSQYQEIKTLWKEVVLAFDMDEAGQEAVKKVMQVIPIAKAAMLPSKDANAALIEGRKVALANSVLFKAETPQNSKLIWGRDLHASSRIQAEWGLSWPFEWLTEKTRGIRFGETYYLGAGVKMGKSELVNAIGSHLITEHGLSVLMAKPEEANNKTYKMVASKIAGKVFHDPKIAFDYEAYDKCEPVLANKLAVLNLYQHLGWKTLRENIMEAVSEGVKAVFIDPITNLYNGIDSGQANTVLQEISQDLSAMAKDLDFVAFIFCHLKAPESGPPHERGGHVHSYQFAGSRAMMRSCNYMIGLEGNKDPELTEEEQNTRKIILLEDREFGESGFFRVFWDRQTNLFNELKEE